MEDVIVRIVPTATGTGRGKLADAELHFVSGALEGLKLVGFSIWQGRRPNDRTVTFPARTFSANGQQRTFALLRPIADSYGQQRIRSLMLDTYAQYELPRGDERQS